MPSLTEFEIETIVTIPWGSPCAEVMTYQRLWKRKTREVIEAHPSHCHQVLDGVCLLAHVPVECVTLRTPRNLAEIKPLDVALDEDGFGCSIGWHDSPALLRDEFETRFLLNDATRHVHAYSDHPTWVKQILALAGQHPDLVEVVSATNSAGQTQVETRMPKEFFSIRPSRAARLSVVQGAVDAEHLDEEDEGSLGVSG